MVGVLLKVYLHIAKIMKPLREDGSRLSYGMTVYLTRDSFCFYYFNFVGALLERLHPRCFVIFVML